VDLLDELLPLFIEHNAYVAHFKDIRLEPDYEKYLAAEEFGTFRLFTARAYGGDLLGYSAFFVYPNIQRKSSLQADSHALFIREEHRGFGGRFIDFVDQELKKEGVEVVYQTVKASPDLNFSPILERKGYQLTEIVWAKRLNGRANG